MHPDLAALKGLRFVKLSRKDLDNLSSAGRNVHAGAHAPIGEATPTVPPLHLATAYSYPTTTELDAVFADGASGYVYARMANPTVRSLEEAIAIIEGTEAAVSYASGMAAIHEAICGMGSPGSNILASRDMYGTTFALLNGPLADIGISTTLADMRDLAALDAQLAASKPAAVYVESISNPLIRVFDLARIIELAHSHNVPVLLDNTFASPGVINGAALGADVVIYSSTKHLSGHGDSTGGIVATSNPIASKLQDRRKLVGAVLSPFDAWLTLRGLRTLDLRVRKQSENATAVADWLNRRSGIARVHHPSLEDSLPDGLFASELRGTMLAFEIAGADRDDAFAFQDALSMIAPATTLGDVQTLVLHPATTSHRPMSENMRAELGITEGLIRLSAGIEDAQDIVRDLDDALSAIGR